jgi:hypothetical protein
MTNIYKYLFFYFSVYLLGLFFSPTIPLCSASNRVSVVDNLKNEPLKNIFSNLKKKTGYTFLYDEKLGNKLVTIQFDNDIIHDVIRKIIQSVGDPNYTVVFNEKEKTIEIKTFEKVTGSLSTILENTTFTHPSVDLDMEITPPLTPGGKGITRRELLSDKVKTPTIDFMDMEITPPLTPGGKGITRRELLSDKVKTSTIDKTKREITPPR